MSRFEYDLEAIVKNEDKTFTDLLDRAIKEQFEIFKPEGLKEVRRRALDYQEKDLTPEPVEVVDENNGLSIPLRYGFSPVPLKKIERTKRKEANQPIFPKLPFENTNIEYNLFPKNPGNLTNREQLEVETDIIQSVADKSYRMDVFWYEPEANKNLDMIARPDHGFRFRKDDGMWKPVNQFYQIAGNKRTTLDVMQNKDDHGIFDDLENVGLKEITVQGLTHMRNKETEVRRLKHSRASAVNQKGQYTSISMPLRRLRK